MKVFCAISRSESENVLGLSLVLSIALNTSKQLRVMGWLISFRLHEQLSSWSSLAIENKTTSSPSFWTKFVARVKSELKKKSDVGAPLGALGGHRAKYGLDNFLDHFFGPFYRGGKHTISSQGGVGCSLSVLREGWETDYYYAARGRRWLLWPSRVTG